ncbi:thioesterase family protein [Streptomyces roseirectus]|uniref:Thioesterase family protein n=1 Tax=Streptomyces roseirectus TaxID=2768066 RepID=A0A7H0I6Z7_9ACTN|nr:thioesterase family protein [Streptomyces roseirectus]QNP68563.1 thioesterase family protein [Streptomyces roseirectus]
MTAGSYYERIDDHRFKPTHLAQGAWAPDEQHFSPLGGLIVHAMDRHLADRPGLLLSRLSYDILGRLALDECEVTVETVRPGRTIELIEAVVHISGRPVVRARGWLLTAVDTTSVAGGTGLSLPAPETSPAWAMSETWPGGYVASLDVRTPVAPEPGRGTAWLSTPHTLVAGEPVSNLASFLTLVDTANGIAVRQQPTEWMFPNVDLTIHLHRQPEGSWTGLDTTVSFGPTGQGLTSTVLYDVAGPVGTAQQILTVRPAPGK